MQALDLNEFLLHPDFSQSHNRYSYVLYNPLAYTCKECVHVHKRNAPRPVAAVVLHRTIDPG